MEVKFQVHWDYIIVGAGSSGCALAHELVRGTRAPSVLVLEAGGMDRSPFIKIPAGVLRAIAKYDWGYRSQPDPTRDGASEPWVRGKVLGGSSSINGMLYVRGAAPDFDRWSKHAGHSMGWSAKDIVPIFCEMEASDQSGSFRGQTGPLHVTTVRDPHALTDAFIKSVCSAGYTFNPDYNGNTQEGVAYMQRTLRRGLRWSAADAFLKPLLPRSNLQLVLNATVQRIVVSKGRAVEVSFLHKGQQKRETARDIILCAGAINSPKLLMLSGVGDPEELRRHAITPVLNLPGVGRNLGEQPLMRLVYRSKIPTYNLTEGFMQKAGFLAKFLLHREGPLRGGYESAAFLRTAPSEPLPDVMLYFAPIGYLGKIGSGGMAPYPSCMICVAKMRPVSTGRIRLKSQDPNDHPLIECSLLSHEADVDTLIRGVQTVRRIMREDPMASLIEGEAVPGVAVESEKELREFVRKYVELSSHPNGTCRMGVDASAVVGPDLRVRGTENLWVADASVMPDHLSANLNAVCIMIGKKLGKQLVARS